jgi:hypothetical protein
LNEDALPPISFTLESFNFWSLRLKILNDWVIEPVVVKTVSKCNVSEEKVTKASALSIKEVLRQEVAHANKNTITSP